MTESHGGVRPPVAAFFATVGFAALAICGFGFTSLLTDTDVLATPGLGQGAGIGAMLLSAVAFALTALGATRRGRYPAAGWVTLATLAGYLLGVVVGGLFTGVDVARAVSGAASFAVSWYTVVLVVAAGVSAWAGIALVRTRAERPQWPWERGDDEE